MFLNDLKPMIIIFLIVILFDDKDFNLIILILFLKGKLISLFLVEKISELHFFRGWGEVRFLFNAA